MRLFKVKKSGLRGIEFEPHKDEDLRAMLIRETDKEEYSHVLSNRDLSDRDFIRVNMPEEIWEYGITKPAKLPPWAKKRKAEKKFKYIYELTDSPNE